MIRPVARTDVNRSAILAFLGAHGATSRAQLARSLSVSPALITTLVRDLLRDGLIEELDHEQSQGGRPARLLGLVTAAGRSVGVKIAPDHLAFVDVGLDGTVIRSAQEPFVVDSATMLDELVRSLRSFIEGGDGLPILGIGVAVPGQVDEQGSGVADSYQLGWNKIPIGPTLRRALELPVLVENNVNALAVAEQLFGIGRDHRNFLVVTIGTGVGAAIVMEGTVMRGGSGGAGEIGHVPVQSRGELCSCGNSGCLETIIGQRALERRAVERGIIQAPLGISEVTRLADLGDVKAQQLFSEAGHELARVLAGVVQVFDPEVVVVLGEGTSAWPHWSFGFEPEFRACVLPSRRGVPVLVESWTDESWAQGAASLVLSTPFDSEGVSGEQGRLVRSRLSEFATPHEDPGGR